MALPCDPTGLRLVDGVTAPGMRSMERIPKRSGIWRTCSKRCDESGVALILNSTPTFGARCMAGALVMQALQESRHTGVVCKRFCEVPATALFLDAIIRSGRHLV